MKFTLSVRSFQVPATPGTCAWPPSLPSVPTSRATRVTSPANALSWSTMVLMVSFSSRISPFTSTVILRDKSPRATAVVTSAMFRTCAVRFPAMALTESVRSFHVPATPGTTAWPPSLPSVPTSRATRVTSEANERSWSTIVLMASFSCRISPRTSTVILRERSPLATAVATSAMFRTWPVRLLAIEFTESVKILPRAGHAGHLRLAAQLAVGAHFAGHARHFRGEHAQLLNHRVDDVGRAQELAFQRAPVHVQPHGLGQVALRHGGDRARHFGGRPQQILHQRVDRDFHLAPGASRIRETECARGSCPSLPTAWPTRFSSCAICSLAATISLKVSAIFPGRPVHDPGRRTEKSPSRMVCRLASMTPRSGDTGSTAGLERPLFFELFSTEFTLRPAASRSLLFHDRLLINGEIFAYRALDSRASWLGKAGPRSDTERYVRGTEPKDVVPRLRQAFNTPRGKLRSKTSVVILNTQTCS